MPKRRKIENRSTDFCGRCQRVGHSTKDCYTLICEYCKKAGHDLVKCRSLQRDKRFIIDSARQNCKKALVKKIPGQCPQNQPSTSGKATSSIDTEMSCLSTIGAYREYLMSSHKDIIEISTPELKDAKGKMMIGISCPITMIKIGKLKDDVTTAKEVLVLEDAHGARVETICLICLSIHINNKTVLHPCRVVSDDFYIETDGIFGRDFIIKSKIEPGKHVELAGIQIPFIANEHVRGVLKVNELVEVSNMDSDSETLTGSSN
ncbi:uncharacterized protein LOC122576873 [Bombus pyrosoma]|uniref:uncharacterized protein LOC122576873 n=1 Tax=Bombus pyrosoma TaxID=396416 RepID=UPI001CB89061|nr:uncharacterized protein LOC122576873 [Bombus pyrosoma]